MTTRIFSGGCSLRIRRGASTPSMPGIRMSIRTRSTGRSRTKGTIWSPAERSPATTNPQESESAARVGPRERTPDGVLHGDADPPVVRAHIAGGRSLAVTVGVGQAFLDDPVDR